MLVGLLFSFETLSMLSFWCALPEKTPDAPQSSPPTRAKLTANTPTSSPQFSRNSWTTRGMRTGARLPARPTRSGYTARVARGQFLWVVLELQPVDHHLLAVRMELVNGISAGYSRVYEYDQLVCHWPVHEILEVQRAHPTQRFDNVVEVVRENE